AQMHQVMKNIISVLEAAHSSLDKVLKMNIYISKPEFFPKMNEIYKSYFSHQNFPARTTLVVDFAEPELLVEIECVAIKSSSWAWTSNLATGQTIKALGCQKNKKTGADWNTAAWKIIFLLLRPMPAYAQFLSSL